MHFKKIIIGTVVLSMLSSTSVQASSLRSITSIASNSNAVFTVNEEDQTEINFNNIFQNNNTTQGTEYKDVVTSVGTGDFIGSANTESEFVSSVGAEAVTGTTADNSEDLDSEGDSEEESGGGFYGYTNLAIANVADHLNVRASADSSSKIVGKMSNDTACEVMGYEGDKVHIVSGSVEGYVSKEYLLTGSDAVIRANGIIQNLATVKADGLKLREKPSTDSQVVGQVAYGEELPVAEELDGWIKINYDEDVAYVSADYVDVDMKLKTALNMSEFLYGSGVSDVRVELCEYAKQFVGNPYVWGGTSLTKGADCSGFVLSVYKKYGMSLPHSSRAQANMGTKVNVSDAKPGDLIFYAQGSRINHVAIYIGGGQVCHASSKKTGIRITSTYYRTPVKAVRLLQD